MDGTTPYTYAWTGGGTTNTITGKAAGTYQVIVTDALGDTAAGNITITQPTTIVATSVAQGVITNIGSTTSVLVSASGGVPPYTGTGVQTNQGVGSHTYTVTDANGCTKTTTIVLAYTSSGTLTATMSKTDISCFGGSNGTASVVASGGVTPYASYLWSPGGGSTTTITNKSVGTYTVVVTDGVGSTVTNSIAINQPTQLLATGTSGVVTTLGGTTSVTITASGGTPPYTGTGTFTGQTAGTHVYPVTDAHGCTTNATVNVPYIPATNLAVSLAKTDVTCFAGINGTITSTTTGGTAPYTFSWNTGQTTANRSGLAVGVYILTVTDANLIQAKDTAIIQQPTRIQTSHTFGTISVIGGTTTVTVSATGGVAPYTGTGSFTQGVGTVIRTITDANGCTVKDTVTLTYTSTGTLTVLLTATPVACFGQSNGSISSSVSGGVLPRTYSWSSGETTANISGKTANTYTLTVTDGVGTTAFKSSTILQPPVLDVNTSFGVITTVGGTTTVTVGATGGTPGYSGTGVFTGVTAGQHIYTVTDFNGCIAKDTIQVLFIPPPLSLVYTQTNITCNGLTNGALGITVSGGAPPYTYLWSNAATTSSITGLSATNYSVTATDALDSTISFNFTITQPTVLVASSVAGNIAFTGATTTITVSATGGTPPYLGTGVFSGYGAGTYNFTVTDAHGCTAPTSATVQPAPTNARRVKIKR